MSIGSGLAASIGFAPETSYGVYAPPTKFPEFNTEDLKKVKNIVQGGGLAGGRMAQLASRRLVTSEAATGSTSLEVANKGFGLILQHIFGGAAVPVQQAATTAWLQSHTLADNIGKSLTVQEAVPDLTGVLRPQTFKGGKITSAEFSCGVDELLTVNVEYDFQRYSEVEALAAPTFLTGIMPFGFAQMDIRLGTFGSEAHVDGVKKVTVKLDRGQSLDGFYAGAAIPGTKREPIMNAYAAVTGSVDADYVDKTIFADRMHTDAQTALVWEFLGPIIASTYRQRFTLKVPAIFFDDGATPVVSGPDVVSGSFPFTAQLDGTNALIACEYVSTDSTL